MGALKEHMEAQAGSVSRPFRTWYSGQSFPVLKRRAMVVCPFGTWQQSKMHPTDFQYSDLLICVMVFGGLISLMLTPTGTAWGLDGKAVIYNGRGDLVLCFIILFLTVATGMAVYSAFEGTKLLVGLTVLLLAYSIRLSLAANDSLGKVVVVLPTKFVLVGLITLCSVFAIGGTQEGIRSLREKKYPEAVRSLAVAAAGVAVFCYLRKLIGRLVKPKRTRTTIQNRPPLIND